MTDRAILIPFTVKGGLTSCPISPLVVCPRLFIQYISSYNKIEIKSRAAGVCFVLAVTKTNEHMHKQCGVSF
jgi:hypothetical protein